MGGDKFRREIREEVATKGAFLELGRFAGPEPENFQSERLELWEERLQALAAESRISLAKLPLKKSAEAKVFVATAMNQSCSVSNGWLAERLQMGKPDSVSQFVRRWQAHPKKTRQVAAILSRVVT